MIHDRRRLMLEISDDLVVATVAAAIVVDVVFFQATVAAAVQLSLLLLLARRDLPGQGIQSRDVSVEHIHDWNCRSHTVTVLENQGLVSHVK